MIHFASFQNYKALRNVSVDLRPLTLILGPNASGKTSILTALNCLSELRNTPPPAIFAGNRDLNRLLTKGSSGSMILECGLVTETVGVNFIFAGRRLPDNDSRFSYSFDGGPTGELTSFGWRENRPREYAYLPSPPGNRPKRLHLPSSILIRFEPEMLSMPSASKELATRVESNGGNLAATIADMRVQSPRDYIEFENRVRSVIPNLSRIGLTKKWIDSDYLETVFSGGESLFKSVSRQQQGYELELDFNSAEKVSAAHVSEGTLLTIGLMTVLCSPTRPQLILIDELERGLHPKALGVLVSQIREIQKQFEDLQIIATSHSPYLVDHFKPEEIILTTLDEEGSVRAAHLTEHPDFERWKDEMKPGEFWSTVGEDWIKNKQQTKPAETESA